MRVPFLSLERSHDLLIEQFNATSKRVMQSSQFLLGRECENFEAEFASYTEHAHCITVGSGLDALFLTLLSLGIGKEDEVIVPAQTFIATWLAVSHCGATPVGVDVDKDTACISVKEIEQKISKKTKAIIPVHLFGRLAEMNELRELSQKHDLFLIEDAAQAHGARGGGNSTACCYSFYPGKNLGALADGGAVTTNSAELSNKLRELRNYGSSEKYVHLERGYNSRLDEFQCGFLRAKLKHLDKWNRERRRIANVYLKLLEKSNLLTLPLWAKEQENVWHLFVVRLKQRDKLSAFLKTKGIDTLIHYPLAPPFQECYRTSTGLDEFPEASSWAKTSLSLPCFVAMKEEEIHHVAQSILEFDANYG